MLVRRRFAAHLFLMLGLAATGSAGILTDSEPHIPPNYTTMQPPAVGGSYVDPVFGTTITRLTDATLLHDILTRHLKCHTDLGQQFLPPR